MIFPAPVRPGDRVAVFAGSSPFDRTLVYRGLGWMRERWDVRFDRGLFERTGYLAGSDERRLAELERALFDPDVRAVVAARGGYGLSRIVDRIDWRRFASSPKWIVGFSDVTALHVETTRLGIASIHGPNVASVGRGDPWTRLRFERLLANPRFPTRYDRLTCWSAGVAEGTLAGGNLTMLHACATAGRLVLPHDTILLLEDVSERPYRVDRMLTTLACGGHLRNVRGVLVGEWTDCHPGPDGVCIEDVARERLSILGVPVVAGAPIGHGRFNDPVVLGGRVRIDGHDGTVETVAA